MSRATFYDIPSVKGAFSPNTWKVRLALNFKGIAYDTEWLEFHDIEPRFKIIGVLPTGKRPDTGDDLYTCPAIVINGKPIAGSEAIADYLDEAFPGAPRLFPEGTRGLQAAFFELFTSEGFLPVVKVVLPNVPAILSSASAEYFNTTRAAWFGAPLSEWAPVGSVKRANGWKAAAESWGKLAGLYGKEASGPWLSGAQPIFADFVLLATLAFVHKCAPEEEWEALLTWHDGAWARLWKAGEVYVGTV